MPNNNKPTGSDWIREHWEQLEIYDDQWIAVTPEKLYGANASLPELLQSIEASDVQKIFFTIHKVIRKPLI